MHLLNIITATDDKAVILTLELANVLSNPIPGAWETDGLPYWESDNTASVKIEPIYNNTQCTVTSLTPGTAVTTTITVKANVNIYDGLGYKPMQAETIIELKPANAVSGLVALPVNGSTNTIVTKQTK